MTLDGIELLMDLTKILIYKYRNVKNMFSAVINSSGIVSCPIHCAITTLVQVQSEQDSTGT